MIQHSPSQNKLSGSRCCDHAFINFISNSHIIYKVPYAITSYECYGIVLAFLSQTPVKYASKSVTIFIMIRFQTITSLWYVSI